MVYNRHHKEKPNFVDGQLIIQTSQIQRICITVDRYLSNFCKSFMHCSPWLFTTRNVEIYTVLGGHNMINNIEFQLASAQTVN